MSARIRKILIPPASKIVRFGDEGAFLLNGDEGLHIPGLGFLEARQHFRLVETDRKRFGESVGKFRVTTLSYMYGLKLDGGGSIDWHWHPGGRSHEHRPHMHVSFGGSAHLVCGRHSFEDVVESCLELIGGDLANDAARRETLDESRNLHNEHLLGRAGQGRPVMLLTTVENQASRDG